MTDEDDFSWLPLARAEAGRGGASVLPAERRSFSTATGQVLSALHWGRGAPEIVFLHGGGQNAHTWDLVIALLGRPAIAIDLPGHGHSSWRDDRDYSPGANAAAVAEVLERVAVTTVPVPVVGMSLGGLTTIALAAEHPALVRSAVIVDITPRRDPTAERVPPAQQGQVGLIRGAREFGTLDEMVDVVVAASPQRSREVLRRGVIHNSVGLPGGARRWRYDDLTTARVHQPAQWSDLGALTIPVMLVTGGDSPYVSADDLAEFRRRLPAARVETVAEAGHAVQSDQPQALVALIEDFLG